MTAPVRIIQFTDLHLMVDPAALMRGVCTAETAERVVGAIREADPPPALCVATGDLTNDGELESYHALRRLADSLPCPVHCAPGNHDARRAFRAGYLGEAAPDDSTLAEAFDHGELRIVLLDTLVPGWEGGHLDPPQLDWLRAELAATPGRPRLLFLHHHPLEIGSSWMDKMMLDNAGDLFEVLEPARTDLLGIFFGHVHQTFEGEWRGVPVRGTPSTSLQFTPRTDRFIPDDRPPGYRIIDVDTDGRRLDTSVVRIPPPS